MTALLAALRCGWSQLPQTARIIALAAILMAGATLWAFEHGKTVGRAQERIANDEKQVREAMKRLAAAKVKTDSSSAVITAHLPALRNADAAARPIDARHVAVTVAGKVDTVLVPVAVVTRMVADSEAIADRDRNIADLKNQGLASDSVIASQAKEIATLKAAPGAEKPSLLADGVFGAAIGVGAGVAAHGLAGAVVGGPVGLIGAVIYHFALRR